LPGGSIIRRDFKVKPAGTFSNNSFISSVILVSAHAQTNTVKGVSALFGVVRRGTLVIDASLIFGNSLCRSFLVASEMVII
jgi:hypothetical protein